MFTIFHNQLTNSTRSQQLIEGKKRTKQRKESQNDTNQMKRNSRQKMEFGGFDESPLSRLECHDATNLITQIDKRLFNLYLWADDSHEQKTAPNAH